ncbi:MAG TPA: hypothetical protein VFV23_05815 [Verrucomicrobiae bacterium]|nr:hypothetical protein [Verrucomicrobiae bacterium]
MPKLIGICCVCLFVALSALAQTNIANITNNFAVQSPASANSNPFTTEHAQQIRLECIENRRQICGKILMVLPEGVVVETGYTNLLREPLTRSWLAPATVTASRAENLIESREPGSICVGTIFLTDLPKSKSLKPKRYDYVIIEGYPAGRFTYTSVGTIKKNVRRYSAQLVRAVELNLQAEQQAKLQAAGVK